MTSIKGCGKLHSTVKEILSHVWKVLDGDSAHYWEKKQHSNNEELLELDLDLNQHRTARKQI